MLLMLLLAVALTLTNSVVLSNSLKKELIIYRYRVSALYDILEEECPTDTAAAVRHHLTEGNNKLQRGLAENNDMQIDLQTEKKTYTQLKNELSECRKGNLSKPVTTTSSCVNKPNTTTAPPPTTTTRTVPSQCLGATNFTGSWRLDHKGSDIRPDRNSSAIGYACDFNTDSVKWFRFTGAAGNKMLNACPKFKSCGTRNPFWTDDDMPSAVGAPVTIRMWGVSSTSCKYYMHLMQVMRCSWDTDHDFIYKQMAYHSDSCSQAFCGMT